MTNKEIWLYLMCRNNSDKDNSGDSGGNSDDSGSGGSGGSDVDTPTETLATEFIYSISNNEVTITGLKDKTITDIVIPSKIEELEVTSIGSYAFQSCSSLTSIEIPNSVTSIGNYAFHNCSSLISVTILSNNITSISSSAFSDCTNVTYLKYNCNVNLASYFKNSLESVVLGNKVTSIGVSAFYNCSFLISATIPNSVTSIGNYAFYNCTSLTDVTLEDNFNCNNLDLSASNKYSKETIVAMLNALADRTGETAYTLKLGSINLAKLTADEKSIATNKNWILA